MKFIILLSILPSFCLAQNKNNTKVIVHIADTTQIQRRIVNILYESGYTIEHIDKALGFLLTNERPLGSEGFSIKIKVLIKKRYSYRVWINGNGLYGIYRWNTNVTHLPTYTL